MLLLPLPLLPPLLPLPLLPLIAVAAVLLFRFSFYAPLVDISPPVWAQVGQ